MLRNSVSGPGTGLPGRILAGLLLGKHRNRPSGRPKADPRADLGAFPAAVRPESGPEGRLTARKQYCVTECSSHMQILDLSFDGGAENLTKCNYNWFPELILGGFCTSFRAGPVWKGLVAQLGRKMTENRPKHKSTFSFPIMTAT